MDEVPQNREAILFGPFRLVPSERLLTKAGSPVDLGARALDILITLVARDNAVVGKKELLANIWPDVTVGEESLRFHVAALRRALGDRQDGARYIETLAGRGYCFVAPISRSNGQLTARPGPAPTFSHGNLPGCLGRMVGRSDDILRISAQLTSTRFVTVVGAGGIGKTTVAIAVGHHLIESFAGAVLFVDLGMLSDPDLVSTVVASMLGLTVQSKDATPTLIAHLRGKRLLLILDTCEHLVDAVAVLASSIFEATSQVHILATSREALQAEGESVYRLDPLACPPDDPKIPAAVARTFPAAQMFVELAIASGLRIPFSDTDVATAASICRKLDGVALAIELTARRVAFYGLQQTATLLDRHLTLLWVGPRTAPARQKTLQATLDWSYGLLSEIERIVLCRLAIFVGPFTLDAALAVVTSDTINRDVVFSAMDSLVAKSLVATQPLGAMMRYRLLDITRACALKIGVSDVEFADLSVRHAAYYQRWLEQSGPELSSPSSGAERELLFAALNNVRAALEWCFGQDGSAESGIRLATAATPVFLMMSLLPECQRWSECAIRALDDAVHDGTVEMRLQAALGVSLMFTRGGSHAARTALERSLAIAVGCGSTLDQLHLLAPLHMFHIRTASFNTALQCAKRCATLAENLDDPVERGLAYSLLGMSLHHTGSLGEARATLETALQLGAGTRRTSTAYLGFDRKMLAGAILARTLWLQGHPDQAVARANMTLDDVAVLDHALTFCIVTIWAISVLLWTGDLLSASDHVGRLIACAESHSFVPYLAVGRGFRGELAIQRGELSAGVKSLQACLNELHSLPYELLTTELNISLAQGLAAAGRIDDGMMLVEETIEKVEAHGDLCFLPELLRIKGRLLLLMPHPDFQAAALFFKKSLALSRLQGARAWELRAAIDFAGLFASRTRPKPGRVLLQPVFDGFVEGANTADLKAAERLLGKLACS